MTEVSISMKKLNCFDIDNNESDLDIGCDMIICRVLMVQIGILSVFKYQFLQWDGATVPTEEYIGALYQTYLARFNMLELEM